MSGKRHHPLTPCRPASGCFLLLVQLWGTCGVLGRDPQASPHLARLFIAHKGLLLSGEGACGDAVMLTGEASEMSLSLDVWGMGSASRHTGHGFQTCLRLPSAQTDWAGLSPTRPALPTLGQGQVSSGPSPVG